jgi:putative heme-binding domain-containing protein
MRILSERPELSTSQHDLLVNTLKDDDAFVQRAAADALGRHPSAENLKPLLALRRGVPKEDTHLLHVARMALRDQLVPQSAWKTVDQTHWSDDDARALADVALGVPTADAARFLLRHAQRRLEDDATIVRFVHHIARFGSDEPALLAFVKADRPRALGHQAALLRAFHQGVQERETPLSPNAKAWAEQTTRALIASTNDNEALTGLELAGLLKQASLQEELRDLANRQSASEARRASALKALAAIDSRTAVELLGRIICEAGEPTALREQADNLLAQGNQAGSRAALLKTLPLAPGRLQSTIGVALASSKEGGDALLEAIAAGKASARLLQERPIELRLRLFGVGNLDARLSKLLAGLPPADTHLQDLINHRRQGFAAITPDVAAGAKVFEKHCAACHQLGGKGARIGPQLDGVGVRGPDRLMEDVLDPNRNIDQAFRMTTLALKDGEVASGLLLREEGGVLILADAQGKEVRVPASNVEERSLSQLSPMPAGLADQISEPDFYDLLGYLIDKAR